MFFSIMEGNYQKMGAQTIEDGAVFTFTGEKEDQCALVLIDKITKKETRIEIPKEFCLGSLRSVVIKGIKISDYFYSYEINGTVYIDEFATLISGREKWNDPKRKEQEYRIYGGVNWDAFDWQEDHFPEIAGSEMFLYKLHVRGFTMDKGTGKSIAGTFAGVEQKLDYLQELGVTTVELMPVYEFEEMHIPVVTKLPDYVKWEEAESDLIIEPKEESTGNVNYWGYGKGQYFAVKASYASKPNQASAEYKHLIRSMHKRGMELVMEMYFPEETNHNLILEVLRFWVREYHVDGFHLLGTNLPITAIVQDVILSRTKIFYVDVKPHLQIQKNYRRLYVYKEDYQYPARRMLNHINGDLREIVEQQKRQGDTFGFVNFISSNNGFTLADVFMYNDKHNEANGENNLDGDTWNFSSNYGVEGPTRKQFIVGIRERLWKNAVMMLFLAQGVPLLWEGDELGNSQNGNNNAYCQDNPVGWMNWKKSKATQKKLAFIRGLVKFRCQHPILSLENPFSFTDYKSLGMPDVSLHGEYAWISQVDYGKMSVGMLYCGAYSPSEDDTDVYVAYNFYSYPTKLALPKLKDNKKWYLVMDSSDENGDWEKDPVLCEDQQYYFASLQSISIIIGK